MTLETLHILAVVGGQIFQPLPAPGNEHFDTHGIVGRTIPQDVVDLYCLLPAFRLVVFHVLKKVVLMVWAEQTGTRLGIQAPHIQGVAVVVRTGQTKLNKRVSVKLR